MLSGTPFSARVHRHYQVVFACQLAHILQIEGTFTERRIRGAGEVTGPLLCGHWDGDQRQPERRYAGVHWDLLVPLETLDPPASCTAPRAYPAVSRRQAVSCPATSPCPGHDDRRSYW